MSYHVIPCHINRIDHITSHQIIYHIIYHNHITTHQFTTIAESVIQTPAKYFWIISGNQLFKPLCFLKYSVGRQTRAIMLNTIKRFLMLQCCLVRHHAKVVFKPQQNVTIHSGT